MRNIVKASDKDLDRIVRKVITESEVDEGMFDTIRNTYQGLKGAWRGEGYDYFKYLSQLGGLAKRLRKLDEPNREIMIELKEILTKISSSKMEPTKKRKIENAINNAIGHFDQYSNYIQMLEKTISTKLS